MKKLRIKVKATIFSILTISMIMILVIMNSTDYVREKKEIEANLNNPMLDRPTMKPDEIKEEKDFNEKEINQPRFMDASVYTIILKDNKIDEIINHTKEDETPTEVKEQVEKILANERKKTTYVGNLYLNQYSYRINNNQMILIDNTDTNKKLQSNLIYSFLLLIVFEGVSYWISSLISIWIIKPVEISFNKQKQFIADASHELKTPLAVIMASAEALENDKNEKWLKNIQNESERMNQLIIDLLDLAKLEKEDLPLNQQETNFSKLIEMAVVPFESLIFENNLKLDTNITKDIMYICNSNEIKQLVGIIMDNAIKHSKEKGTIKVLLKKEKDKIILKIQNEGEPIPKGEEEKIFERFYRVDKARNRKENRYGLGLAIAKSIVERHKGQIKAESINGWTTFEINFYLKK